MNETKCVLQAIDGVLGTPRETRSGLIKLLSCAVDKPEIMNALKAPGSVEAISQAMDSMMKLSLEDRTAILSFLKSFDQVSDSDEKVERIGTISGKEIPLKRGIMGQKAKQFLSGLPTGTKVTALSICKRAEIKPANMYEFCKGLAKKGLLERIGPAIYRVLGKASTSMRAAEELASLKPRKRRRRRRKVTSATSKMSPKAYIEAMPPNKTFKLKKVKTATGSRWNSVTACATTMAKKGVIKRKSRGVYVKV